MSYQNISAQLSDKDLNDIRAAIALIHQKLPFLINLTTKERRQLFKMGDKSLTFVSDSVVTAQHNPDILPSAFDLPEYQQDFALAQHLNEILMELQQLTEEVDDTLMAVGSEAMQSSLAVYDYVKTAAKHQPGLKTTAEQLGERFASISRSKRQKREHAEAK